MFTCSKLDRTDCLRLGVQKERKGSHRRLGRGGYNMEG